MVKIGNYHDGHTHISYTYVRGRLSIREVVGRIGSGLLPISLAGLNSNMVPFFRILNNFSPLIYQLSLYLSIYLFYPPSTP